ncbi:hypothetical protein LU351_00170 [Marinibactrum halimedae]|nr:hypothetical protein [Marinibactrum halimedae]MCD9457421.1 hypothetical protein [Marinibactrum halimedae]
MIGCSDDGNIAVNGEGDSSSIQSSSSQSDDIPEGARSIDEIAALEWVEHGEVYNPEAPIPSQCYTKTDGVSNPCYVCHQSYPASNNHSNKMNDGFLQGQYIFSDFGVKNRWVNLFKDRTDFIDSISDEKILEYVNADNYSSLISWMNSKNWKGEVPYIKDLQEGALAFDEWGLALDGSRWVAFNYKPLPSTFWPTNGSTDDVMIRLPNAFSEVDGAFSKDLYFANLSLLEMNIKGMDEMSTPPLNEAAMNIDIDQDGVLSVSATRIIRGDYYLGDAASIPLVHMLYPKDTEFLHTVRYLGVEENGRIVNSKRMKEVRYLQKRKFMDPKHINSVTYNERKEKHFEKLPMVSDYGDNGMSNKNGWMVWGFIEDAQGELRKQHHEEQMFCMGCHKSIGANIDHTFSFPRKLTGAAGWGYIDLTKLTDVPNVGESEGEYLTYLERVGGGDEFRQNAEMLERWFDSAGEVKKDEVKRLNNIYELIAPSVDRALSLNKAYLAIVKEQSYLYGRDTVMKPATNVLKDIDRETVPLLPENRHQYDMRLDWSQQEVPSSQYSYSH